MAKKNQKKNQKKTEQKEMSVADQAMYEGIIKVGGAHERCMRQLMKAGDEFDNFKWGEADREVADKIADLVKYMSERRDAYHEQLVAIRKKYNMPEEECCDDFIKKVRDVIGAKAIGIGGEAIEIKSPEDLKKVLDGIHSRIKKSLEGGKSK